MNYCTKFIIHAFDAVRCLSDEQSNSSLFPSRQLSFYPAHSLTHMLNAHPHLIDSDAKLFMHRFRYFTSNNIDPDFSNMSLLDPSEPNQSITAFCIDIVSREKKKKVRLSFVRCVHPCERVFIALFISSSVLVLFWQNCLGFTHFNSRFSPLRSLLCVLHISRIYALNGVSVKFVINAEAGNRHNNACVCGTMYLVLEVLLSWLLFIMRNICNTTSHYFANTPVSESELTR